MNCLGIDTSNYRTSAALYHAENGTYQNSGRLLPVDEGKLGLRQSDALFLHCKALPDILAQLDGDALRSVAALGTAKIKAYRTRSTADLLGKLGQRRCRARFYFRAELHSRSPFLLSLTPICREYGIAWH